MKPRFTQEEIDEMVRGKEFTEQWIAENDIRDSTERIHAPHGIWTSGSRLWTYVCFDDNPSIGQRAWSFWRKSLKRHAYYSWQAKAKIERGTRLGVSTSDSGAGYLFRPYDVGWDRVDEISCVEGDHETGCRIVRELFAKRKGFGEIRRATEVEENLGIDLVCEDTLGQYGPFHQLLIEVKTRQPYQKSPQLFLQLSETNNHHLKT